MVKFQSYSVDKCIFTVYVFLVRHIWNRNYHFACAGSLYAVYRILQIQGIKNMIMTFLQSIAQFVSGIIGMIINVLVTLGLLLTKIPAVISYIVAVVGYMPPFVGGVILVSISYAIVTVIINHWGNA